jgi:hypothetical protein
MSPNTGGTVPNHGISKVFKAMTNSSQRVRAASKEMKRVSSQVPTTAQNKKRAGRKEKKIKGLETVLPAATTAVPLSRLKQVLHFYTNTTASPTSCLKMPIKKSCLQNDVKDLTIVDTVHGCHMEDADGNPVFTLVPREKSLPNSKEISNDIHHLKRLQKFQKTNKRGVKRGGVSENVYATTGAQPGRNKRGVHQSSFAKSHLSSWNYLVKMVKRKEKLVKQYTAHNLLRGLAAAKAVGQWATMEPAASGTASTKGATIFPALASARNYYSAAHDDPDFFLSAFSVYVERESYILEMDVAQHFCFPEVGVAIAIRPGDLLIFNPAHYHCCSQKEEAYDDEDVYLTSFYLKSAVVGLHDNELPFTPEQMEILLDNDMVEE